MKADELCRRMFAAAVARAQPAVCLPAHLPDLATTDQVQRHDLSRLVVLACGKAGASMSEAVEGHYLDGRIDPDRLVGLCVTRHGYGKNLSKIRCTEAGHPVPDAAGLQGTEEILALAQSAGPDDFVLVLISGGGSANWIAPAAGLTMADKQAVTKSLLASGAPISEINTVRKHLSRIKGGRLAAAIFPARSLTLAISDVPGDDLSLIASGPTVPDRSTAADAAGSLRRWRIATPPAVDAALLAGAHEGPIDPRVFDKAEARIVARPADSLAAAAALGRQAGYEVVELGDALEGEAREVGGAHGRMAAEAARAGRRVIFLSGGELTVTVTGRGQGGPNQEYALALAQAIDGVAAVAALAGDTDGTDGGGGNPDDPAGAIVDGGTIQRAQSLGLSAAQFLQNNDATGFFRQVGGLLHTGPTGTNVNDFRCALVDSQNMAAQ